jgi:hypothetical protein
MTGMKRGSERVDLPLQQGFFQTGSNSPTALAAVERSL